MKNIIIIIIDAFRPKNLSLFGYKKETDKNLKKIAKEGIVFRNFFSSSNATAPSLMSIFTAKFPNNHGIIHQFPYTTEEEIEKMYQEKKFWLPSYLKDRGYNTIAIDWLGMFFEKGFNYYKDREENSKMTTKFVPAKDTMDLAISRLEKTENPFFLFTHFWDTHFPFSTTKYNGTKKNIDEVLKDIQGEAQKEYFKKRVVNTDIYSVDGFIEKYDVALQEVDKQIGKLYEYLKERNLWDDTILIIMGDHGTNLTEHNIYFSSSSLFDDTIHVPFIIHIPGFEAKEVEGFTQNVDITPTILELLGEDEKNEQFDGKSMISLIKNNDEIRDRVTFYDGLCQDVKGIRTKNKKLILAKDPKCNLCKSSHHQQKEIYDLERDTKEEKNVYPEIKGEEDFLLNEKEFSNLFIL